MLQPLIRCALGAVLCIGAVALATPASAQEADVLAPAREGAMQCYTPNIERRTCRAIATYTFAADGAIDSGGHAVISPQPVIIMTANSPVVVRDGAVCGPFTLADLERATFTVDGRPASLEETAFIREQVAQAPGIIDTEVCSTYTLTEGGVYRTEATVDGVAQPDFTDTVIWVRPEDGYTVAP